MVQITKALPHVPKSKILEPRICNRETEKNCSESDFSLFLRRPYKRRRRTVTFADVFFLQQSLSLCLSPPPLPLFFFFGSRSRSESICNEREMDFVEGDVELKEIQKLEGHIDRVWGLAWNPVHPMLASCSGDKTVRVWQQNPGGKLDSWECKAILEDTHMRTVRSCAWSPCGKLLATASFDATTAIWQNVGNDFECVASLEGHENEVKSVSWNSSGSLLATCGRDKSVWIWEVQPGNEFECASVLQGHTQDVKMVQWHPFMDVLVSVSYDNSIKIWVEDGDSDDWHCVQTLGERSSGHSSTVWALSFNSAGDRLVTCSDDLTLKIWDTSDSPTQTSSDGYGPWRHLCTISGYHDRTIFSVHWSRDGVIASGAADDAIRFFVESKEDLVDGPSYKLLLKKEKAHNMDVNSVQWNPKETGLLASASDDGTVKIWQLANVS